MDQLYHLIQHEIGKSSRPAIYGTLDRLWSNSNGSKTLHGHMVTSYLSISYLLQIRFHPSPHLNQTNQSLFHNPPFFANSLLPTTTATMAAAAAALQQAPTTFQSRSLPSSQQQSTRKIKLSLSTLFLPKLTLKLRQSRRRTGGGGASGARMAESAAGSYANALADVAKSNNTLPETCSDLESIDQVFSDDAVVSYFVNPTITDEEKGKIIDEIAKKSKLQPHVANFLNILVDMKRMDMIREIIKEFDVVYNKLTETELAVVSSVVELESQHLTQIAKSVQKLTGARNVRIKTNIDPSLVAGFTIRYGSSGSKLIDMSVKKQLEEIAVQLDLGDIQLAV